MTRIDPSFQPNVAHLHTHITTPYQTHQQSSISSSKDEGCSLLSPIYALADFVTWVFQTIFCCCFDYSEKGRLSREFLSFVKDIKTAKEQDNPKLDVLYENGFKKLAPSTQQVLEDCAIELLKKRLEDREDLKRNDTWKDQDEKARYETLAKLGKAFANNPFTSSDFELVALVNDPGAKDYETQAYNRLLEVFKMAEARLK